MNRGKMARNRVGEEEDLLHFFIPYNNFLYKVKHWGEGGLGRKSPSAFWPQRGLACTLRYGPKTEGQSQLAQVMNQNAAKSNRDTPRNPEDISSGEYLLHMEQPATGLQGQPGQSPGADTRETVEAERRKSRLHTPHVLIIGFAGIILLGTLLLKLPASTSSGVSISWIEALFTSTSAVTVTGLGVLTTATDFTRFGPGHPSDSSTSGRRRLYCFQRCAVPPGRTARHPQ